MKELIKPVLEQEEEMLVQALCETNGSCLVQCLLKSNSSLEDEDDIIF